MEYWAIPLDATTRSRLTEAEFELGSIRQHPEQGELLTFRDRFVAMKVAARLGARAKRLPQLEEATPA